MYGYLLQAAVRLPHSNDQGTNGLKSWHSSFQTRHTTPLQQLLVFALAVIRCKISQIWLGQQRTETLLCRPSHPLLQELLGAPRHQQQYLG